MPFQTIREMAAELCARTVSSVELTQAALRNAQRFQDLNAFITLTPELALQQAKQADEEIRAGRYRGWFHGIPIAHKDLFYTQGVRTTSGSRIYGDFVPDFDAAVVERFQEAGAVLIGKTGLHEHAYGITSNNPHFGAVRNPWDRDRIPGGSSGGSAAAVAVGIVPMATGTDTGGSIRIPASFCGMAGIKPTFGRVSKYGVFPLSYTLDHMGPIARTVEDCAVALQFMAGFDRRDPYCVECAVPPYLESGEATVHGVRIGLPDNFFFDKVDPEVKAAVLAMAHEAEEAGAVVEAVRLPDMDALTQAALRVQLVEAAWVHEPHRARESDYGKDIWGHLERGRKLSTFEYVEARETVQQVRRDFLESIRHLDCLMVPATATPAPRIGQTTAMLNGQEEDVRLLTTRTMRGINALGVPALALPSGLSSDGLPLGLQLVGQPWQEALLFRVGMALEARYTLGFPPLES